MKYPENSQHTRIRRWRRKNRRTKRVVNFLTAIILLLFFWAVSALETPAQEVSCYNDEGYVTYQSYQDYLHQINDGI